MLILVLTAALGVLASVVLAFGWRRESRLCARERIYREGQAELGESMQLTQTEREAHSLLKRHLERSLPGSFATILAHNDNENRLEAATELPPDSPLRERLTAAAARECVAIRCNRLHEQGARDPLLACGVCGAAESATTCVPSLVGGEVIGSVLVMQGELPLDEAGRRLLVDSVAQSAPVLANLRNLALAETRAETDALTGLPNSRAVCTTLKRMLAQAGRTLAPLSVILVDLDRFKLINDVHGHDRGDDALAAVGDVLTSGVRESDYAGRYGGDEFLVILPATDRAGAVVVAEKLREAIGRVVLAGVQPPLTASLGVASLPADGVDGDSLVRRADRALYAAKAGGRNRVMVAGLALAPDRPVA